MSSSTTIHCQSDTCPNGKPPSRLECPTCNKLGLVLEDLSSADKSASSLDKTHKLVHALVTGERQDGTYNPFPTFSYTGSMRPVYPLSVKREIPDHIPKPDYADDGRAKGFFRDYKMMMAAGAAPRILNPLEQEKMRTVCRLGREILDIAASHVKPGITTDEIDEIVHNATIERNAYPSPLNYRAYPKSVCTSVNEVVCHGIPDKRKLREGDIINIDVSVYYDGFHSDLNATYPVGNIDEDSKKLIRTTRECLDEAIKTCKPGALFRDIGKVIEPIARANGCSTIRTYTGHGTNTLFHCSPNIPHFAKNKAIGTMKAGMTFTIEPMINLGPNWGDIHWPDNWTATTIDGKRSAQFEETLLITETGVDILTAGKKFEL